MKRKRLFSRLTLAGAVLALALGLGTVQAAAGSFFDVFGRAVNDGTDRPVAGATVTLTSERYPAIYLNNTTNGGGHFKFERASPGTYILTVSACAFQTFQERVVVTGNKPTVHLGDIRLRLNVIATCPSR